MSIIGEYIHYDFSNYNEFGLNKPSSDNRQKPSYYSIINRQKKSILQKANSLKKNRGRNKEELQKRLNFFRPLNNNLQILDLTYTQEEKQQIEEIICDLILEKLSKYKANINFFDLSASNVESTGTGIGLDRGNLRWELAEGSKNLVSSIKIRLEKLDAAIKAMKSLNLESAVELDSRLSDLQKIWQDIEKDFSSKGPDKKTIYWEQISVEGSQNFTHKLNALWLEFKRSIKSFVQGQLGEYYAALSLQAASFATKMGVEELRDFLKQQLENKALGMSGFNTVKQGLGIKNFVVQGFTENKRNFSQDVLKSQLMSGKGVKVKAVQGKVDLQITEEMYDIGNYNISIKNYSPEAGTLTVQSGENLIFKLTQSYPDFINHYLNITASGTPGLVNNSLVQIMNETLKLTLVISGLIGDYYTIGGSNLKADTLIYKKNNQFEVVFMDEIIKKILNNPSLAIINELSNNKRWAVSWIGDPDNYSYPLAYSRIVNILSQLNNFNINSIKISTNVL